MMTVSGGGGSGIKGIQRGRFAAPATKGAAPVVVNHDPVNVKKSVLRLFVVPRETTSGATKFPPASISGVGLNMEIVASAVTRGATSFSFAAVTDAPTSAAGAFAAVMTGGSSTPVTVEVAEIIWSLTEYV